RQSLSPTRVTGCLQQDEATAGSAGRGNQIVCYSGDIRGLFKEMDSFSLGILPANRHQGDSGRKLVESAVLPKNQYPIGKGKQGENSQHHERPVLPCDQMGMDREESNSKCSPEREATKDSSGSRSRRDYGNSQRAAQSASHDGRAGRLHRLASRRTYWASMGGRGFRESGLAYQKVTGGNGRRSAQDRSVSQRGSIRHTVSGIAVPMETGLPIHGACKLGVCLSAHERHSTILARNVVALLWPSCIEACWNNEACDVSHVPAHVWNAPERQWRKRQGGSRIAASRQPEGHDRCVHAGRQSAKTRSPKQADKDGHGKNGGKGVGLTGPNWTMTKNQDFLQVLWNLGVPDGI